MVDYKAYKDSFRKRGEALRARLRKTVRCELPSLVAGTQELLPMQTNGRPGYVRFCIRLRKWVFGNRLRNSASEFCRWVRKMLERMRKPFWLPPGEYGSRIQEYGSRIPERPARTIFLRWDLFLLIGLVALVAVDSALASRLEAAARNAQTSVIAIAQITSTIGIALGGALMSVGWSQAGRQVLGGGVVGAFASFGGPALIDFVRSVF
jgi:hypothetical protein